MTVRQRGVSSRVIGAGRGLQFEFAEFGVDPVNIGERFLCHGSEQVVMFAGLGFQQQFEGHVTLIVRRLNGVDLPHRGDQRPQGAVQKCRCDAAGVHRLLPLALAAAGLAAALGLGDHLFESFYFTRRQTLPVDQMRHQRHHLPLADTLDERVQIVSADLLGGDRRGVFGRPPAGFADDSLFHQPIESRLDRRVADRQPQRLLGFQDRHTAGVPEHLEHFQLSGGEAG